MPARRKTTPKVFRTAMLMKGSCLLIKEIRPGQKKLDYFKERWGFKMAIGNSLKQNIIGKDSEIAKASRCNI